VAAGDLAAGLDVNDTTPPVTTDDALTGWQTGPVTVHLTPTDSGSGMSGGSAQTEYRIDGGPWKTGTSVTLRAAIRHKRPGLAAGDHLVEYRSIDNAGNTESIKSCTLTL